MRITGKSKAESTCTYNVAVACQPKERNCDTCGWNPEVLEHRLSKQIKEEKKSIVAMMLDRCVCCGKIVPEGRQVCWECERYK